MKLEFCVVFFVFIVICDNSNAQFGKYKELFALKVNNNFMVEMVMIVHCCTMEKQESVEMLEVVLKLLNFIKKV